MDVERVLHYKEGDLYIYFLDMQFIVHIPVPSTQYVEELHFYYAYASFSDFLLDQSRSGEYFIDTGKAHAHLTICWRRTGQDTLIDVRVYLYCGTTPPLPRRYSRNSVLSSLVNFWTRYTVSI